MLISFLQGILRVWGLSPREHWVGGEPKNVYWAVLGPLGEHWNSTEICTGSAPAVGALGALAPVLGVYWELWGLYWGELELHSEPQDP